MPREGVATSAEIERRLRERLWRMLWSEKVEMAVWVRSKAEAANAKKPPDLCCWWWWYCCCCCCCCGDADNDDDNDDNDDLKRLCVTREAGRGRKGVSNCSATGSSDGCGGREGVEARDRLLVLLGLERG